jgi:hypothetical protein
MMAAKRQQVKHMPVRLISSQPAEWPAHLPGPGDKTPCSNRRRFELDRYAEKDDAARCT